MLIMCKNKIKVVVIIPAAGFLLFDQVAMQGLGEIDCSEDVQLSSPNDPRVTSLVREVKHISTSNVGSW